MAEQKYHATSLTGATREVRRLREQNGQYRADIETMAKELVLLAKLASKTPQFFNPMHTWEAEKVRDRILIGGKVLP